jgi:hypothetical protein
MSKSNGLYKYFAVYVKDQLLVADVSELISKEGSEKHKLKLPDAYHWLNNLLCDLFCDDDQTLWCVPKKFSTKLMDQFGTWFDVTMQMHVFATKGLKPWQLPKRKVG